MIPLRSSEERDTHRASQSAAAVLASGAGLAPPTSNLPRGPSEPRGLPQAPPPRQARRSLDGAQLAVAAVAGRGRWGRGPRWSKGPERKAARRGRARWVESSVSVAVCLAARAAASRCGNRSPLTAPRLPAAPLGRWLPLCAPSASPRGLGGEAGGGGSGGRRGRRAVSALPLPRRRPQDNGGGSGRGPRSGAAEWGE